MRIVSEKSRASGAQADLALMKLVGSGDAHAQRVLAHRLAPRVQRIAHRLLANADDADDAAQVSLMEILRGAANFREESSVERWADRITVRTSLRHARQRRSRFLMSASNDIDGLRIDDETDGTDSETGMPRRLFEYLSELPDVRREVLVMKHALGYTTEEIAELIDKPVGTVKDRLVAARKQIRKLIMREQLVGVRGDRSHG